MISFKNFLKPLFITFLVLASLPAFANSHTFITKDLQVIRVIDGDTIVVTSKNHPAPERIRLLGINSPELFTSPQEDFSLEAKTALEKILDKKNIYIEINKENLRDKYNRILADVYLEKNNLWVNGYMVENGFAFVYILSNGITHLTNLINKERFAINNHKGLWQNPNYRPTLPSKAINFTNKYKIVTGKIINVKVTRKYIWLNLENSLSKGLSLRITKKNAKKILPKVPKPKKVNKNYKFLIGKKVEVRGFIEHYSPKFGPFIDIRFKGSILII